MRKDEILKKSLLLIDEGGLEDFSMRKLANELKCKPPTIYHYYQTKNDILNDLYLSLYKKFFYLADDQFDSLEDFLYLQAKMIQEHRKEFIFLIKNHSSGFLSKETISVIKDPSDNVNQRIEKLFAETKNSKVNLLLVKGPLTELAFMDKCKLSDEELKTLVHKICCIIKEDD